MARTEQRQSPDRRKQPRGGRRPEDRDGFAPLIMLVGDRPGTGELAEAVLAKMRFAVAISRGADDALESLASLRPDLVIAGDADARRIRLEAPEYRPVLEMTDAMRQDPHSLIDSIRQTLRTAAG